MRGIRLFPVRAWLGVASLFAWGCGATGAANDGGLTRRSDAGESGRDAQDEYVLVAYDGSQPPGPPRVPVHAETISTRVYVGDLMFASGEMQTSGEPFASLFAGRNLGDYDRLYLPVDMYLLNNGSPRLPDIPIKDLFGFSTAVESYEYSKYYMNMVIEETTAGVSLAYGPVTQTEPGTPGLEKLRALAFDLLSSAGSDVGGFAVLPAPTKNPTNYLGFPGLWPAFAPFEDFDPAMKPTTAVVKSCNFTGGYLGSSGLASYTPVYECDYNSTHLSNPATQVHRVLTPATLGYTVWKEALWGVDFAGRLHDSGGNAVNDVAAEDLALVGKRGNKVIGTSPPGLKKGTYIGSSPVEGMWGLMMIANMDNVAEWMLSSLMTADGATLDGFAGTAQALAYDYTSPLLWFPNAIAVTEDDTVVPYPPVTDLSITDGTSSAEALSAILLGDSLFFGMTDPRNVGLGQRNGLEATFDGDPFPGWIAPKDGIPNGQDDAHDRALSMIRIAFVDLDRIHADPALGVLLDTATISGSTITRGTTVSTTVLAHDVIGLFQTFLGLNSAITQYGGADPDPALDADGILNGLPIHPPGSGPPPSFSRRVRDVFTTNAAFFMSTLTKSDGSVCNGATVAAGEVTPSTTTPTLDSQAAALRALIVGYLATSDSSYFARAQAVARHLLGPAFYSAPARMYRGVEGGADDVTMTPPMYAWLQSSLRETYKALFVEGDPLLDRTVLEDRIARIGKLYLNGWDDRNGDQKIQKSTECLAGRMQQAEQALTGELGRNFYGKRVADRDGDCVIELSHAHAASTLAAEVHFHAP